MVDIEKKAIETLEGYMSEPGTSYSEMKEDITESEGKLAKIPDELSEANQRIQNRKDEQLIVQNLIKAFAAYRGLKKGIDLSKVEIQGTDWDSVLKGEKESIQAKREGLREGLAAKRGSLSDRIRYAHSVRSAAEASKDRMALLKAKNEAKKIADESKKTEMTYTKKIAEIDNNTKRLNEDREELLNIRGIMGAEAETDTAKAKKQTAWIKIGSILGKTPEELNEMGEEQIDQALIAKEEEVTLRQKKLDSMKKLVHNYNMIKQPMPSDVYERFQILDTTEGGMVNPNLPVGQVMQKVEVLQGDKLKATAAKIVADMESAQSVFRKYVGGDTDVENALEQLAEDGFESLNPYQVKLVDKVLSSSGTPREKYLVQANAKGDPLILPASQLRAAIKEDPSLVIGMKPEGRSE